MFFDGKESKKLDPGRKVILTKINDVKIGISICYDLRFPELYREQLEKGAKMFIIPNAWPIQRLNHFDLLTRTRAIENQCYLAACNRTGELGKLETAGHSRIVDPWGVIEYGTGEEEKILEAKIDLEKVGKIRKIFPALKDRKIFPIKEKDS